MKVIFVITCVELNWMSMVNFTLDLSTNKNIMSAPAKPTYQQLVTSALGDYKKQSAQAFFLLVSTLL